MCKSKKNLLCPNNCDKLTTNHYDSIKKLPILPSLIRAINMKEYQQTPHTEITGVTYILFVLLLWNLHGDFRQIFKLCMRDQVGKM